MRCARPPFIAAVLAAAAAAAHAGTVAGSLQGRKDVDHVVRAGAGQTLRVNLQSAHGALQFNVLSPGPGNVAMFANGSADQAFERVLPVAGRYIVRVTWCVQRRGAARRQATRCRPS
jgi:hypothetical protein